MWLSYKSYGEYTKVDKPVVVTKSYERSNNTKEELKTVPVVVNNNNENVVSVFNTDSSKKNLRNDNDNFFDEDINDQVKVTPKPLSM